MKCNLIKSKTVKNKLYYKRTLMVDIKIDYPVLLESNDFNNISFNTHYRKKINQNYRYASTKLYNSAIEHYTSAKAQGFPFHGYEFVEVFEPTYCKKPFIS